MIISPVNSSSNFRHSNTQVTIPLNIEAELIQANNPEKNRNFIKKHKKSALWLSAIFTTLGTVITTSTQTNRNLSRSGIGQVLDKLNTDDKESITILIKKTDKQETKQSMAFLSEREGIRSHIYNDAISIYNIANFLKGYFKHKGNYTAGIGFKLTEQKGSIYENLEKDLKKANEQLKRNVPTEVSFLDGLTPEQIILLTEYSLIQKEKALRNIFTKDIKGLPPSKIKWDDLSSNQKTALLTLAFNIGEGRMQADKKGNPTKLLKFLREGDFEAAQAEIDFYTQAGTYRINIVGSRYLEMLLLNDGILTEQSKNSLFNAVKKCGFKVNTPDEAIKLLNKNTKDTKKAMLKVCDTETTKCLLSQ